MVLCPPSPPIVVFNCTTLPSPLHNITPSSSYQTLSNLLSHYFAVYKSNPVRDDSEREMRHLANSPHNGPRHFAFQAWVKSLSNALPCIVITTSPLSSSHPETRGGGGGGRFSSDGWTGDESGSQKNDSFTTTSAILTLK